MKNLYLKEKGTGNKETIIFLHGGAVARWMYDEQIKAFKDYHCIIPDLPEHGQSIDVKPFTIADSAERIIKIIRDRAHNGRAHLVGISLGAQIILQILSTMPNAVDHALISGTFTRTIPQTETILKLLDYAIKVYEPVKNTDFFIKANMRTYNMPKYLFDNFKESTHLIKHDALRRILTENMLFKMPKGLEKVKTPVLVLAGEKDYKIIKESACDLIKTFENSKGYMVPNLGHLWNLESPDLFNQVLRSWINNVDLSGSLLPLKY